MRTGRRNAALLLAVESEEWDRVVDAKKRLRAILDAHSVPLND